jgi:hypothetical protein
MEKEALKRVFDFLEEKEGYKVPFLWKLFNNIPLTEEDLNVNGDLDLSNSNITLLPEGLKVSGTFDLGYSNITSLSEGLKVGDDLYLSNSNLSSLPKGLEVGGFIFIYNTPLTEYTNNELREMIKPGFIKGRIIR